MADQVEKKRGRMREEHTQKHEHRTRHNLFRALPVTAVCLEGEISEKVARDETGEKARIQILE